MFPWLAVALVKAAQPLLPDNYAFGDSFAIVFSRLRQGYGGPSEKPIRLWKHVMPPRAQIALVQGIPKAAAEE